MAYYPYQYINLRGEPTIKSQGVSVGTRYVDFKFKSDAAFGTHFRGKVLVYLADSIPEATSSDLIIRLSSDYGDKEVMKVGGEPLTVENFPGVGVYDFYYDRATDTLQIMGVQ